MKLKTRCLHTKNTVRTQLPQEFAGRSLLFAVSQGGHPLPNCCKPSPKRGSSGDYWSFSSIRTLDLIGCVAYENGMSRKDAQKDGNQSRDQRLKNALKQNLQRRKSQAKARSSAEETAEGSEAEDKGQNG
jgi:hypothetical protein